MVVLALEFQIHDTINMFIPVSNVNLHGINLHKSGNEWKKKCSSYYVLIFIASYFNISLLRYCSSKTGDYIAKACEDNGNRAKSLRVFASFFIYVY